MDAEKFYYKLRPSLFGYNELKFEGYQERITSPGGNAGNDPHFQLFDAMMGITFEDEKLKFNIEYLRSTKFAQKTKEGIIDIHKNSLLREYCKLDEDLKRTYN